MHPQPSANQPQVKKLAQQAIAASQPTAWFDQVYAQAQGDATKIPWAKLTPHPYLQDWLNNHNYLSDKDSALVIGCGLGDDAEALAERGFHVTAFDISPDAITWCQQRFPDSRVNYVVADLLTPPSQWLQAFDLVIESRTIQSLPLNIRTNVINSVAALVADGGTLLVITGFRVDPAEPDGPPWHLLDAELAQFLELGFHEVNRLYFMEMSQQRIRVEYRK
jgi:SAM-dependent methyltransferase